MAVISSLFVYPVKSCRGISVAEMGFDARGPCHDRRWMVVDENGQFITQRSAPQMALIQTRLSHEGVIVSLPGADALEIGTTATTRRKVRVWKFEGEADDVGDVAAAWFSAALGRSVRVVHFSPDVHRSVSRRHTALASEVAFADGYPVLLTSVESLGELNRRLVEPIPMNRFRPNVVVRDCQPFEEDLWSTIAAPEQTLSVVKPCSRCAITTVEQLTGRRGREPLATLAQFRKTGGGVTFGQNCVPQGTGTLRVGDELETTMRR
jgi:uncharacterized protein YcbX